MGIVWLFIHVKGFNMINEPTLKQAPGVPSEVQKSLSPLKKN